MRASASLLILLALAGCAGPAPTQASDSSTTPAATTGPSTTPAVAAATPTTTASPAFAPGVVFEERYDFSAHGGSEVIRAFNVTAGARQLQLYVETTGPPPDKSFANAVMDVYEPHATGALFAELPAQQDAHGYWVNQTISTSTLGEWHVRFAGQGKTAVYVRATVA